MSGYNQCIWVRQRNDGTWEQVTVSEEKQEDVPKRRGNAAVLDAMPLDVYDYNHGKDNPDILP
jgi:hypothetical protein